MRLTRERVAALTRELGGMPEVGDPSGGVVTGVLATIIPFIIELVKAIVLRVLLKVLTQDEATPSDEPKPAVDAIAKGLARDLATARRGVAAVPFDSGTTPVALTPLEKVSAQVGGRTIVFVRSPGTLLFTPATA